MSDRITFTEDDLEEDGSSEALSDSVEIEIKSEAETEVMMRPAAEPLDEPREAPRHAESTIEPDPPQSSPEPESPRIHRALKVAIGLGVFAVLCGVTSFGWFLNSWIDGSDDININRPVRVVESQPLAQGYVPNVLGLSKDSALQAMVDSGVEPSSISTKVSPHVGDAGLVVDQSPSPGTKAKGKKIVIGLSGEAKMPELRGQQLDDVRAKLTAMGAKIDTEYRYKQGAKENEVISTSPVAGVVVTRSVKLFAAEPLSSVFLSDIEAISNDCSNESATVGGEDYEHSLVCSPQAGQPSVAIFQLNRKIETFTAKIGLADDGDDSAPVRFVVKRDRTVVGSFTVRFGQTREIKVPVVDALRLTLQASGSGGTSDDLDSKAVWANARLVGGGSAIDSISAADQLP